MHYTRLCRSISTLHTTGDGSWYPSTGGRSHKWASSCCRTVKQLLDSIEVARSAELDELPPAVPRKPRAASVSTSPAASPRASAAAAPQTDVGQRRTSSFGNPGMSSSGNLGSASSGNPGAAARPMRASGTASIGRPPAMPSGRTTSSTGGGLGETTGLPSWIGAPVNQSGPQLGSKQPGSSTGSAPPGMKPISAGSLSAGSSSGWGAGGGASSGSRGVSGGGLMAGGAGSAFSAVGDPLDWMGPGTVAGEEASAHFFCHFGARSYLIWGLLWGFVVQSDVMQGMQRACLSEQSYSVGRICSVIRDVELKLLLPWWLILSSPQVWHQQQEQVTMICSRIQPGMTLSWIWAQVCRALLPRAQVHTLTDAWVFVCGTSLRH